MRLGERASSIQIFKQPRLFLLVACPDGEPASTSPGHAPAFSLRMSPRSFQSLPSMAPPQKGGARLHSQRGSGAPFGANLVVAAPSVRAAPVLRSTGFASRRSTAAFSIPGAPLPACPATAGGGGVRDIDPSLHSQAGGCPPRTPGTTTANRGRGHRSPSTLSFASRTSLSEWGYVRHTRATRQRPEKNLMRGIVR